MTHSFDVEIAKVYGVNAAILLNHIVFWIQKNQANRRNFYDGTYWTYNSRSAFAEIFPYMSERQIKTALDKLIDGGIIRTGNYNRDAFDKSLWYALTENGKSIMQKCQIDIAKMSDRYGENVRPIPDIEHTDIDADINTDNGREKRKRFEPPTVDDVRAYALEKGWSDAQFDANRFVDFYESKGWRVGNQPMKDWKACARGWVSRDAHRQEQAVKTNPALQYKQREYDMTGYGQWVEMSLDDMD